MPRDTAPAPTDPMSLLTRGEVAALLRVSVKTVDRLRDGGQLPGLLIGSRRFYRHGEVLAYLDDQADVPPQRAAS